MRLALFFTFGVSLRKWLAQGLLTREMKIYERYGKSGVPVDFITYGEGSDRKVAVPEGVEIHPVYSSRRRFSRYYLNVLASLLVPAGLKEVIQRADVLKTNQMEGAWVAVIASFLYKKPLLVRCGFEWYRNRCVREKKHVLKRVFIYCMSWLSYRCADAIAITSRSDADFISDTFRVDESKIHLVPNYIDTESFRPQEGPKTSGRILYVGRIVERKNLKAVIGALEGSSYGLDVYGEGEHRKWLEKYSKEKKVDTVFHGVVPNERLPSIMNRYEIFVLFSAFENNPKSLLEAMACGLTVVASDVEGIREIVRDGETGFLSPPKPDRIRKTIDRVMGDESLRRETGARAREQVVRECSLEAVFRKERKIVERLAAGAA